MKVRVANRQRRIPLRIETYKTGAEKVLLKLGQPEAEIGLSFLSDRRIQSLNRLYRGKDQPTDVLAFPLMHSPPVKGNLRNLPSPFLGDVVISPQTARRQALARKHSITHEITYLMIHGILHLLGHDHEQSGHARRMRRAEQSLLRHLTRRLPSVNLNRRKIGQ